MEYLPYVFCGTLMMEDSKPSLQKYSHAISIIACCVSLLNYFLYPSLIGVSLVQQGLVTLGWQGYWYVQLPYMEIIPYHLIIPLGLALVDNNALLVTLSWLKIGDYGNLLLWEWTFILCVVTITVLVFWSISVDGNHGHLQVVLGRAMLSWWVVPFFSVWNAAVEEIEFRGLHLQALLNAKISSNWFAIVVQGLTFGLMHYRNGFPSGLDGLIYTTLWACVMAILRINSGGMIHPILVHVAADFTIGILIRQKEQELIKASKDGVHCEYQGQTGGNKTPMTRYPNETKRRRRQ